MPAKEPTKLWFDDVRKPPDDSWIWCRTFQSAQAVMRIFGNWITEASLDHDLGGHMADPDDPRSIYIKGESDLTGLDFVKWLCEEADKRRGWPSTDRAQWMPKVITIHSWNPPGANNMASYLRQWAQHAGVECEVTVREYEVPR